ncbi:MAG TPA: CcdB family protein [Paraburkholderia sp.]
MARFEVYINPAKTRANTPYLVDVQSDFLDGLTIRVVVPLIRALFPSRETASRFYAVLRDRWYQMPDAPGVHCICPTNRAWSLDRFIAGIGTRSLQRLTVCWAATDRSTPAYRHYQTGPDRLTQYPLPASGDVAPTAGRVMRELATCNSCIQ